MTQSQRSKSYIKLMIARLHIGKVGDFYGNKEKEIRQENFIDYISNYSNITYRLYLL